MTPGEFAAIEGRANAASDSRGPIEQAVMYRIELPTSMYDRILASQEDVPALLAAVRERDNTIARAEAAVTSAALKVLADFDTVMNVKSEVAYIVAEYNRALRAALDPQETP